MNQELFYNLKDALFEIGNAFISDLSIWWLIAPVIILWILTEIYAGEYEKESFSFSGLLAGGISLAWVTIVSVRIFFLLERDPFLEPEFIALAVFSLYALLLIYIAFTHNASLRVAKWIGRSSLVYFVSILAVLWGQGVLELNQFIIIDLFIIFILIDITFAVIKSFLGLRGEVEMVRELGNHDNQD